VDSYDSNICGKFGKIIFWIMRVVSAVQSLRRIRRPRVWDTPEDMAKAVDDYIDYTQNNPVEVDGVYGKDAVNATFKRQKVTTIQGFCAFCGTIPDVFNDYSKKQEFSEVIAFARNMFSSNNFELAGAGVAHINLVSRIEGLVDKKEISGEITQKVFFEIPKIEGDSSILNLDSSVRDIVEGEDWNLI
jgi:DNA-packaging protein gp3